MRQLTLRVSEELVEKAKAAAASNGKSLNGWASAVLEAAVDPELAGNEAEKLRERFMRAGLLMPADGPGVSPPDRTKLEAARAAAGKGTPLSDLVSENRR